MQHERFEHQHVANTLDNERSELQNVKTTVEIAASSSKQMLQIAKKMDRTGIQTTFPKRKEQIPKQFYGLKSPTSKGIPEELTWNPKNGRK